MQAARAYYHIEKIQVATLNFNNDAMKKVVQEGKVVGRGRVVPGRVEMMMGNQCFTSRQ